MNVEVVFAHCLSGFLAEQVVVDEGLGSLACKLHHHASRCVGVHVGILSGDVVLLSLDDFLKHVGSFCFPGHIALVPVVDVGSCHLLAGTFHEFQLHLVLNGLHTHLALAAGTYAVGDALYQAFVFTRFGGQHGFAYSCLYFLFVISHHAPIAFHNSLYHLYSSF